MLDNRAGWFITVLQIPDEEVDEFPRLSLMHCFVKLQICGFLKEGATEGLEPGPGCAICLQGKPVGGH